MKKHLMPLVFLCMATTTMVSCDLKEEIDMLKRPIHVQGEVDPQVGVPLAEGQLTLGDVLGMLSSTYSGMIDPDSNTITITYDGSMADSIMAGSLIAMPATKGTLVSVDTVISYGVNIDLFDDVSMQSIVDGNIDINHLFVNLHVGILGACGNNVSQGMKDTINSFVSAVFDNLDIRYEDHAGEMHTLNDVQMTPQTVRLDTIVDNYKDFTVQCDVAEIVNAMPRRIIASIRFRFDVDESIFNLSFSDLNYFSELMDSIKLTKLIYDADLHVEFPFDIHIGYLPYSFTLDMGENGLASLNFDSLSAGMPGNMDVELKDSKLDLRFVNGIPLNIDVAMTMLDGNGVPVGLPLIADTTIAASQTIDAGDNNAVADPEHPTATTVSIDLDNDLLERLKNTRHLRFDMAMHTGNGHVKIRKTDYLKIKAVAKMHPAVGIDIPITGSDNE